MNNELFMQACEEIIGRGPGDNGIGTLSEKTVHSVLKKYLSPDSNNHEIKVCGFVADIYTGADIYEIQTRSFDKLRRKLSAFLALYPVTIVYPIPHIRWIRWVNPDTGEISAPRKSPKKGTPYSILPELYKIKNYLTEPGLKLHLIFMDLEEYKYLDGWSKDKKKGATRCDRIPTSLVKELRINKPSDYQQLIPESLSTAFTSRDYKAASGLSLSVSQLALNTLTYVGAVKRTGKRGNSIIYERSDYT